MDETGNKANGSEAVKTIERKSVGVKTPSMAEVKKLSSVKVRTGPMQKA